MDLCSNISLVVSTSLAKYLITELDADILIAFPLLTPLHVGASLHSLYSHLYHPLLPLLLLPSPCRRHPATQTAPTRLKSTLTPLLRCWHSTLTPLQQSAVTICPQVHRLLQCTPRGKNKGQRRGLVLGSEIGL